MKKQGNAIGATLAPDLRARLLSRLEGVKPETASAPPLWKRQPLMVFGGGGAALVASAIVFAMLYGPAKQFSPSASQVAAAPESAMMKRQSMHDYDDAGKKSADVAVAAPMEKQLAGNIKTLPTDEARRMNEMVPSSAAPVAAPAPSRQVAQALDGKPVAAMKEETQVANGPVAFRDAQTKDRGDVAAMGGLAANGIVKGDSDLALVDDRQVHREANIGVAVEALEASSDKIEEMVQAAGGYVASNYLTTDATSGYKSAQLSVKVPVKEFDHILGAIGKLGDVQSKNVTGEDITQQVSDATSDEQVLTDEVSRASKQLQEQRMSDKRTGQKEEELRQLRLQLARTRARLGLLRKMAALSTIQISLTQKAKKAAVTPEPPAWLRDLRETNKAAMLAFQSAVRVPIVLIVWTLAFSPIWVPLILAYRWASLKSLAQKAVSPSKTAGAESES
jgi:hypothetical protein